MPSPNPGARTIATAIRGGADSVAAIGTATLAGTNCGSCKPALEHLLHDETAEA